RHTQRIALGGRQMETRVMIPASKPRPEPLEERLLGIDPRRGTLTGATIRDLPSFLSKGDLLVRTAPAPLPASLASADGRFELRLLSQRTQASFDAILFGEGDYRTPTERRPP